MSEKKKEFIRAIKFTLLSISAGVIQFGSYSLMNLVFHWQHAIANPIAIILSVLWNFTLNRKFTFHSANNVPIAMLKVAAFYVAFIPLTTWGGHYLESIGWIPLIIEVLTMLLNFVLEFFYCRFVVFGNSIDTAITEPADK